MKFANGYGSITKLSGERRRPYWVRSAAIKYVEDGKVKTKRTTIGYYKTQKEAIKALSDYNDNPYDLNGFTVSQIWEKVKSHSSWNDRRTSALDAMFKNHLTAIANTPIKDIKAEHLQTILDTCNLSKSTQETVIVVIHSIYKYAIANDIIGKDYSQYLKTNSDKQPKKRNIFTSEDISKLWSLNDWRADLLLILLYTGCRVHEITDNTINNLNLENNTIFIPEECAKTSASIRFIPIHDKIISLIKKYAGNKYIFEMNGDKIKYESMYNKDLPYINKMIETYGHTFHDTRHTFTTKLRELDVDVFYIDELTGHRHKNVTDSVYTHISIDKLSQEINKLNYDIVTNV